MQTTTPTPAAISQRGSRRRSAQAISASVAIAGSTRIEPPAVPRSMARKVEASPSSGEPVAAATSA